jgi:hypothetical protein
MEIAVDFGARTPNLCKGAMDVILDHKQTWGLTAVSLQRYRVLRGVK